LKVLSVSALSVSTVRETPGIYFLASGPVRLGVPRAPVQVKTLLLRIVAGGCATKRLYILMLERV